MSRVRTFSALLAALAMSVLILIPVLVGAQSDGDIQMQVDREHKMFKVFDAENVDATVLLRRYFKEIGENVSISPVIKTRITINLRSHSYRSVLLEILRQAKATYRIEGGVTLIYPLAEEELNMPAMRLDIHLSN